MAGELEAMARELARGNSDEELRRKRAALDAEMAHKLAVIRRPRRTRVATIGAAIWRVVWRW